MPFEEWLGYGRGSGDVPLYFDSRGRDYSRREVERLMVSVHESTADTADVHDPMADVEEAVRCS